MLVPSKRHLGRVHHPLHPLDPVVVHPVVVHPVVVHPVVHSAVQVISSAAGLTSALALRLPVDRLRLDSLDLAASRVVVKADPVAAPAGRVPLLAHQAVAAHRELTVGRHLADSSVVLVALAALVALAPLVALVPLVARSASSGSCSRVIVAARRPALVPALLAKAVVRV